MSELFDSAEDVQTGEPVETHTVSPPLDIDAIDFVWTSLMTSDQMANYAAEVMPQLLAECKRQRDQIARLLDEAGPPAEIEPPE